MKKLHDTLYKGIESINLSSLAEPFSHYTSNSRNKLIARAFKEAGLIERYGSGVPRIHKICQEY